MRATTITLALCLIAAGAVAIAPLATADPIDKVGNAGERVLDTAFPGTGCNTWSWNEETNSYEYQQCY